MLITSNDIITIVGPTAKQPQLEILHSSGSGTKDLGTPTETDALAENIRSKRALGLTQPKYYLANGEDDGYSYNYLLRIIYLHRIMPDPERRSFIFFIKSLHKYLFSTYYEPNTLLGTGDVTLNKTDKNHCHHRAYHSNGGG